MEVCKAIIPAAGLGTRFLPFSKAVPKEMLPLLNKPAIQYIIEEGLESDITNFTFVTCKGKEAIANHFDEDRDLELILKGTTRNHLLANLKQIIRNAQFSYVRQSEARGLGHAIWSARHLIDKEYFGIFLPDDIMISRPPALAQLIKIAKQERASVIAVQEVEKDAISSYGIVGIKKQITPNLFQLSHLVEKPLPSEAPSNLGIIGRYVLSHKIFPALEEIETDIHGELQLTDGISQMLYNNEKVFAYKVQGVRYDIGTPLGWIKATIGCALQHPEYANEINAFLHNKELIDSFFYNSTKILERSL
jgi:UTP--glucose-1-phosphate uridylyltransferase